MRTTGHVRVDSLFRAPAVMSPADGDDEDDEGLSDSSDEALPMPVATETTWSEQRGDNKRTTTPAANVEEKRIVVPQDAAAKPLHFSDRPHLTTSDSVSSSAAPTSPIAGRSSDSGGLSQPHSEISSLAFPSVPVRARSASLTSPRAPDVTPLRATAPASMRATLSVADVATAPVHPAGFGQGDGLSPSRTLKVLDQLPVRPPTITRSKRVRTLGLNSIAPAIMHDVGDAFRADRRQSLLANKDALRAAKQVATFGELLRDESGRLRDPFEVFDRNIVYHILSFLPDSDLYSLSSCCKRLLQYCLADLLVWERRLKRRLPFHFSSLWQNLVCKRFPEVNKGQATLTYGEKYALTVRYVESVVDREPYWPAAQEVFVKAHAIGDTLRDKAIFYLYNVIRNPALRTPKVIDKFFGDPVLVRETIGLFSLGGCTLFEAMHCVFGHALSLPGEAQKIDRVMQAFGDVFFQSRLDGNKNTADSFFVLAFAVVMLNSDLHNPAVKNRMSLLQFRRNLAGSVELSEEEARYLYMQVLRVEMIQGACVVPRLTKSVWLVRSVGPLGYKRKCRATLSLCAGELVVLEGGLRFSLRDCLMARNSVPTLSSTLLSPRRPPTPSDAAEVMPLLHVMRVDPNDDPDMLLRERFNGRDLIVTCDEPEDLHEIQCALASHMLPQLQRVLNRTLAHLAANISPL